MLDAGVRGIHTTARDTGDHICSLPVSLSHFFVIGYVKESPLEEVTSSLEPLPSVDLSESPGQSEQAVANSAAPIISGAVTPTEQGLPDDLGFIDNVWLGDLDEMVERRVIRVLTVLAAAGTSWTDPISGV